MKFIITVLLFLTCAFSLPAQTEKIDFVEGEVKLTALILAKEDSKGNIIENVKVFAPTDIPIICYVDISPAKPVAVTLHFIAVKVKGIRPNKKIITSTYKTKKDENEIDFEGRPDKRWIPGSYRIEITIDGKLAGSKEFTVVRKRKK